MIGSDLISEEESDTLNNVPYLSKFSMHPHIADIFRRILWLRQDVGDLEEWKRSSIPSKGNMAARSMFTRQTKIIQGAAMASKVVVDSETLMIRLQRTEFSQERQILSGILHSGN